MNLLVILSHDLTRNQGAEAKEKLKVQNIILMPEDIKKIWNNINPVGDLPVDELDKISEWIKKESNEDDYVLIQGDFGAVFYLVDYCLTIGRIPIYSTTSRKVEEIKVEDKVVTKRTFEHLGFRKYKKFKE